MRTRAEHPRYLADTEADARNWLKAHSHPKARIVPAGAPEPRTFTYLQDPDHGWLIVNRTDLVSTGMSSADFTRCSYVLEDSFAREEDCLDERGIAYKRQTNGDAYVRHWACNPGPTSSGAPTIECQTEG